MPSSEPARPFERPEVQVARREPTVEHVRAKAAERGDEAIVSNEPSFDQPSLLPVHPRAFAIALDGPARPAPATELTASVAPSVTSPDRQTLAAHVSSLTVQNTTSEVEVEGLGRIRVEARLDHGGVDLSVRAERAETVEIVRSHANAISDDLRNAHIPLRHAMTVTSTASSGSTRSGHDFGDAPGRRPRDPEPKDDAESEDFARNQPPKRRVRIVL